ncbi:MAG: heavy-metal-associated domain-containing protein [Acidobacteriota bacterium]
MEFKRTVTILAGVAVAVTVMIGCGAGARDVVDEPVTVTFDVAGMTCESCEEAINHTVGQLHGIEMVESRHDPGSATVLYRPGEVTREAIVEVIEGLGYTVVNQEE